MIETAFSNHLCALQEIDPKTAGEDTERLSSIAAAQSTPSNTYRTVGISKGDFLNVRQGPGSNYRIVERISPDATGLALGVRQIVNGTTIWKEISINGHRGWVSAEYLLAEPISEPVVFSSNRKAPLTDLINAVRYGSALDVSRLLSETDDINATDESQGATALHYAARRGQVDIVGLLLKGGADVNSGDDKGATPLHIAALKGNEPAICLLLASGADVMAEDEDGWTPLHFAALQGHDEVVQTLLKNGAEPNTGDNDGWTPLHAAAINGREQVVTILISSGADMNAVDSFGETPLHLAATAGQQSVVSALLASGADPGIVDKEGNTPAECAAAKNHPDLANLITTSTEPESQTLP